MPVLSDEVLVLLLVIGDTLCSVEQVDVVTEVVDEVLNHLQIVVVLSERIKVLLLPAEVLVDPLPDIDLLVNLAVLKELYAKVASAERDGALGTRTRT